MNKEQLSLVFGGVLACGAALFALFFSLAPSKPYVKPIANRTAQSGEVIEFPVEVERRHRLSGPVSFRLVRGDEHGAEVTLNDGKFRWEAPSVPSPRDFDFEIRVESRQAEDNFQDKTGFRISVSPSSSGGARAVVADKEPEIVAVARLGATAVESPPDSKHAAPPGETLRLVVFGRDGDADVDHLDWSVEPPTPGAKVTRIPKSEVQASFDFTDAAQFEFTPEASSAGQTLTFVVKGADAKGNAGQATLTISVSGAAAPRPASPSSLQNFPPQIVAVANAGSKTLYEILVKQYALSPGDTLRLSVAARDGETRRGPLQWSVEPADQGAVIGRAKEGAFSASFDYADLAEFQWTAPKAAAGKTIEFNLVAADAQGASGSAAIKVQVKGAQGNQPPAPSAAEYQIELPPKGERVLASAAVAADASVTPNYSAAGARRATLLNKDGAIFAHVVYQPTGFKLVNLLQTHYATGGKRMLAEYAKNSLNGRVWLYDKQGGRELFAVYSNDRLDGLRALLSGGQPALIQEWENDRLQATHWVENSTVKKSWTEAPDKILQGSTEEERAALAPLFERLAALEKQIKDDELQTRQLLREQAKK